MLIASCLFCCFCRFYRRVTAHDLAKRLEVSPRTIHRDMVALGMAGVPVTAERGSGGGWGLLEAYQTTLTGLSESEIQALFLGKPPHLLADLGLNKASEAALIKLFAAVPAVSRHNAEDIRERIHKATPGIWWLRPTVSHEVIESHASAMLHDWRSRAYALQTSTTKVRV